MLVFLQRLWVMIVVDGFLLYIIIRLLREKTEVKKEEKKVGPAPKPEKYIGRLLDYEFRDEHGRTQSGSIKEYPCLLGRGRNCDTQIVETEKNGHYFLAREFIQITETADVQQIHGSLNQSSLLPLSRTVCKVTSQIVR